MESPKDIASRIIKFLFGGIARGALTAVFVGGVIAITGLQPGSIVAVFFTDPPLWLDTVWFRLGWLTLGIALIWISVWHLHYTRLTKLPEVECWVAEIADELVHKACRKGKDGSPDVVHLLKLQTDMYHLLLPQWAARGLITIYGRQFLSAGQWFPIPISYWLNNCTIDAPPPGGVVSDCHVHGHPSYFQLKTQRHMVERLWQQRTKAPDGITMRS